MLDKRAGNAEKRVKTHRKADDCFPPDFALAVTTAREADKDEREYSPWLRQSFRGLRSPTGKGHGGKPRFAYVRRGGFEFGWRPAFSQGIPAPHSHRFFRCFRLETTEP